MLTLVGRHWGRSARQIIDALYGAVRSFCGEQSPLDDMTAIVIKADLPPEAAAAPAKEVG